MVNIVLTNQCNVKCSYCFAKEYRDNYLQNFNIENFIKAINFIKTGRHNSLGLVGGEPAIHKNFGNFIEIIDKDKDIKNCNIYTNGIETDKYISILKNSKFGLLINCNSPNDIGSLFCKLENNIKLLTKKRKKEFILGMNLYSPVMDYSYIFDLLKITKQHKLRFSISVSNTNKQNCNDVFNLLGQFNDILLQFYNDCIKNEVIPYSDCVGIPHCLLNDNLKKSRLKIIQLQKKYKIYDNIFGNPCSLEFDILPDLTAVRSICYPYYEKVFISDFKNVNSLINYFYNNIDIYHKLLFISDKCKTCKYRLLGECNICPVFTVNQFYKLKNYVLNKK